MFRGGAIAMFLALAGLAQTVEGTATNLASGQPLAGVKVSIEAGGKTVRDATTDAQGGFRIEALAPGEYRASFSKRGFEPAARDDAARKSFYLTGGATVRLDVRLAPMAKISGRVLDASGTPVPKAFVQILGGRVGYDDATDPQGRFSFDEVSPGVYRLWAQAPKGLKPPPPKGSDRMAWVPTFFPGVAEVSAASRLELRAGAELWDQEIRLLGAPVHRIRGVVLDAGGMPAGKIQVTLGSNQGISFKAEDRENTTVSDDAGAFEFPDVNDGVWRISAERENAGAKLRAFTAETMAGHDLEGVRLRLSPPFTVYGTVVREGPPAVQFKKAPMLVILAPDGGGSVFHQAAPDEDGRFAIEGVHAGRYTVRPISPGPPFYLASIRIGEREIPYQQPFDLLSGSLPVTVVYRSDGGGVRGSVEDCGSATVIFYPREAGLQVPEFTRRATCGDRGHFEIANMRPGEYYGFALEQAPGLEALFFGFSLDQGLLNQAIRVTVRPGEFTDAELHVIRR